MSSIPKATHAGEIEIGTIKIPCAVLENGVRVLSENGITNAILGSRSGYSKRRTIVAKATGAPLPLFLAPERLKHFISKELINGPLTPIIYNQNSRRITGFDAEVLPGICDVWLQARDAGVLQAQQLDKAKKAEILMRGLARVGITALVDEATGYQEIRDREELQKILDKYLRAEFARWSKRFPDEFYKEIFRLRDWHWRGMKVNRPQVVGRYTKNIVWARLAPGVLAELERLNPPDDKGEIKVRHHQYLTDNVGHAELQKHLNGVIVLMKSVTHHDPNKAWTEFQRRLQRVYPMVNTNFDLPFDDDE